MELKTFTILIAVLFFFIVFNGITVEAAGTFVTSCSLSDSACGCGLTSTACTVYANCRGLGALGACAGTCSARANTTGTPACTLVYDGCVGRCSGTFCNQASDECDCSGSYCSYTCSAGWENCDTNDGNNNGCECNTTEKQCSGASCLIKVGYACTKGTDCASGLCADALCQTDCSSKAGKACSSTSANYNLYGTCAYSLTNGWSCDTGGVAKNLTGTNDYYTSCNSGASPDCKESTTEYCFFNTPCDTDASYGFGASGVCGGDATHTLCCDDYARNNSANSRADICGTETAVCGSYDGYYCDDVSDGDWNTADLQGTNKYRCDATTSQCILCYTNNVDNMNNCQFGCGASASCDSQSPSTCGGTSGYCGSACQLDSAFDTSSSACNCKNSGWTPNSGAQAGAKCCESGDYFCNNTAAGTLAACENGAFQTNEDSYRNVCECYLNGDTADDGCSAGESGCWAVTGESGNHCCRQASDTWCDGSYACNAGTYQTDDETYQQVCDCSGGGDGESCSDGEPICWMASGPAGNKCCDSSDSTCASDGSPGTWAACQSGTYRTSEDDYRDVCECGLNGATTDDPCSNNEIGCWAVTADSCCRQASDDWCDGSAGACTDGNYSTEEETFQGVCQCKGTHSYAGTCAAGETSCWMASAQAGSHCCDSTDNVCNGATSWLGCVGGTYNTSTDLSSYLCESCNASAAYYNTTTETKYETSISASCCGDDASEYRVNRICAAGICDSNDTDWGCCASASKCTYSGTCRSSGYKADVDGDGLQEKCKVTSPGEWVDGDAPKYSLNDANATEIVTGEPVLIYANWTDNYDLNYSWLVTNETGNWVNYTGDTYDSPYDINLTGGETWSNFTWDNDTFASGVVAWKIYANDSENNENVTEGYFTVYVPDAAFAIAMPTNFQFFTITDTSEGAATQTTPNNISFNFSTAPEYWVEPCAGGDCINSKQNGAEVPIYYVNITGNVPIKIGLRLNDTLLGGLELGANASCAGTYASCQTAIQTIGNTYVSLVDDLDHVNSYANITLYANLTNASITAGEKVYEIIINSTAKSFT